MERIIDECCDCATEYYRCRGNACPRRHVKHFFCDICGAEEKLFYYDNMQLCIECLESELDRECDENELDVVEGSGNVQT